MPALLLFHRLLLRPLSREWLRTLMIVLSVALGAGVVLAIELAGNAAAGSFHSSIESLAGDNNLEVVAAGGLPETVVATLAGPPYPLRPPARIEDSAGITTPGSAETLPLIGLDLIAEGSEHSRMGNANADALNIDADENFVSYLNRGDSVWVGAHLGKKPGEKLPLLINDHTREYTVRGVFPDSANETAIVMDIATAQRELNRGRRIDRILIKVPDQPALDEWQRRIARALPEGVQVRPQGSGTQANRRMLAAFRWNLRILSYVALVVGAFLIYNTISVSVVRRRAEIGIVRALGASRRMVLFAFVGEAFCFGLAGSLLGLFAGRIMVACALRLMAATVELLYVSSRPGPLGMTAGSVAQVFIAGTGVAVLSALAPAREASQVSPVEAMARGRREFIARVYKTRNLMISIVLGPCPAGARLVPPIARMPLFGYLAALLLIGSAAFAIPALVAGVTSVSSGLLRKTLGVEAMLAARSLASSLRRTSVLAAALATAIAMMTSVGIMLGSFRQTVLIWVNNQLIADLYVRPAGSPAMDRHPVISVDISEKLARLPGVAVLSRLRAYEITYEGLPATLASAELQTGRAFQSSAFISGRSGRQVLAELRGQDAVVISEPFSNKHCVRAGDRLMLPFGERRVVFRIADVYYDYSNEAGNIIVDRNTLLRYLPDPAASGVALYLEPGTDPNTMRANVIPACAGSNILVLANRGLRREAIRIFDRTFAITYALEAVAILFAIMGVAGALLALVIDRRRELGLLRFLGAATAQVRKLILLEAGLLGLLASFAGLVLGYFLSLVLIYVINKQSFGWTIQFHWPVAILVSEIMIVYVSTVLAGLYPARIAMRLNPIEVIHED